MKISVHRVSNRENRELLRDATHFFLTELIPARITKDLTVAVTVKSHLGNKWACCSSFTPRKFEIEIQPHKWVPSRLLKTLGHECVHIKQYATGEMKEIEHGVTMWKRRKFNENEISYENQPWEIEASSNEWLLWQLWKDHLKH